MTPPPELMIAGISARIPWKTPARLMSMARRNASMDSSCVGASSPVMPALLTATCSAPSVAVMSAIVAATASGSVTSIWTPRTLSPASAATLATLSPLMSAATTCAPRSANLRTHSAPIPEPPPVTKATLPSKPIFLLLSPGRLGWRVRHLIVCKHPDKNGSAAREVLHHAGLMRMRVRVLGRGAAGGGQTLSPFRSPFLRPGRADNWSALSPLPTSVRLGRAEDAFAQLVPAHLPRAGAREFVPVDDDRIGKLGQPGHGVLPSGRVEQAVRCAEHRHRGLARHTEHDHLGGLGEPFEQQAFHLDAAHAGDQVDLAVD